MLPESGGLRTELAFEIFAQTGDGWVGSDRAFLRQQVGAKQNRIGKPWSKLGIRKKGRIAIEVGGLTRKVVQRVIEKKCTLKQLLGFFCFPALCEEHGLAHAGKAFQFLFTGLGSNFARQL